MCEIFGLSYRANERAAVAVNSHQPSVTQRRDSELVAGKRSDRSRGWNRNRAAERSIGRKNLYRIRAAVRDEDAATRIDVEIGSEYDLCNFLGVLRIGILHTRVRNLTTALAVGTEDLNRARGRSDHIVVACGVALNRDQPGADLGKHVC